MYGRSTAAPQVRTIPTQRKSGSSSALSLHPPSKQLAQLQRGLDHPI